MRYYLAPLEGITTYIYRNAYAHYWGGVDKYFTPFISDKNMRTGKTTASREIRDILPENNADIPLVPQILTNRVNDFITIAGKIASYGYRAVNLNLGCPSGTVTAKKRGSGFLSVPDELDAFLYGIYEKCPLEISIKTRLGISDLAEWDGLLDIYGKYPISELIVHTRLQQEFYVGRIHPEAYAAAIAKLRDMRDTKIPLCYNGDIVSVESLRTVQAQVGDALNRLGSVTANQKHDSATIKARYGTDMPGDNLTRVEPIDCVMIGRGIIRNPGLIYQLQPNCDSNGTGTSANADICADTSIAAAAPRSDRESHPAALSKERLRAFHDEILDGYIKIMSGDSPVLFKMKDLWTYMSESFAGSEKYLKKIRKTSRISEYVSVVDGLFRELELKNYVSSP